MAWPRAAGIALLCGLAAGVAGAVTPQEQAENCAEAERRYSDQFGKRVGDEPVTTVLMYKHTFCPPQITVRQGTKIRFLNIDRRTSHSYWFKDAGKPESERFFGGESVEMVVDLPPGEHTYLCGPHWQQDGMIGKMIVVP